MSQEVLYVPFSQHDRHQVAHVRTRRLTLITIVVVLYLLAVGTSAKALVSGNHWWGLDAQPASSGSSAWQITWIGNSLINDYPVHVGDQITLVDGHAPESEDQINTANTLQIVTATGAATQPIRWQAPSRRDNLLSMSWVVLGLVSLILGLLVFLHATDRILARRFFFLFTALALVADLEPAASFGQLLAIYVSSTLSVGVFFGLLANFLWRLLFPVHSRSALKRRLPEVPVVTGLLAGTLYLVVILLKLQDFLLASQEIIQVNSVLSVLLSLGFIARASFSHRAVTKERSRALLSGVFVGILPLFFLTVLPELLIKPPLVSGNVSALAVIALPLSFGYAIVRRDLLRLDSLIRKSAQGMLGVIGLAVVAVLLAQALKPLPLVSAVTLGVVAGAVFTPLIWRGAQWITEAWLFPQMRAYRRLITMDEAIDRTGLQAERIAAQLVSEVHLALPVRRVALFVPEKRTRRLLAVLLPSAQATKEEQPTAVRPPEMQGVHTPPPILDEATALTLDDIVYSQLNRGARVVLVEPDVHAAPSGEPRTNLHGSENQPNEHWEAEVEREMMLDLESWHLLLPMRVQNRLVAILALSRREDGQAYSDTDQQLLRILAARRALTLDYALLYAELHTAYERRQELDRLKDQFIVTAHHELRTPLTGVQGYLELLRDLGPEGRATRPEEVQMFVDRACRAADELNEQLDSLLMAAEADLRQTKLISQAVDLASIGQRVIQNLDSLAQRGHHRVRSTIPPELQVRADPKALFRVLLNLLSNALKYSPEGRPVIFDARAFLLTSSPGSGGLSEGGASSRAMAEIVVRDWGRGIPPKEQYKLFERFTRLERDLNSTERGSGLGLAICKELIEGMGGNIWVESSGVPGAGSAFHLTLPLVGALNQPSGGSLKHTTAPLQQPFPGNEEAPA
ncbi:MAG TPA: ATP-binding protein [Ktedonobacterales bacterium]|jgi:signal transduction histidine kinase